METFLYLCSDFKNVHIIMAEQKPKFDVLYSEEADAFLDKQYRLLAFWDKRNGQNTLVIATHGFIKKTQKTPKGEIEHAQSIKDIYFKQNK
jgi:hypothetical protein